MFIVLTGSHARGLRQETTMTDEVGRGSCLVERQIYIYEDCWFKSTCCSSRTTKVSVTPRNLSNLDLHLTH